MTLRRRHMLQGLFGVGGAGLVAAATGLSPAFLRSPTAWAKQNENCAPDAAQFLIWASSSRGDPFNANCPGSYEHEGVIHPDDPAFAPTDIALGSVTTRAAQVWTRLPASALNRSCFIHHATRTGVHPEMPKVLRMMGATDGEEMVPSLLAAELAPCLDTIQSVPVNVGRSVNLTAGGRALPRFRPTALKQLLVRDESPLVALRSLRDQHLDAINTLLKDRGTTEQRRYLDANAQSRVDARKLADDASSLFDAVVDDSAASELLAAVALIKLRVSPVVTVSLPFGGDNHSDPGLAKEIEEHPIGIDAIATLVQTLEADGMADQVTFALMNVFGRTLTRKGRNGRDHWSRHAVSLMIGKHVRPGVIGGLAPYKEDFGAVGIDSASGQGIDGGGDIPYEEGLGAVGKTIGAAAGVRSEALDERIDTGKVIAAALV